MDAVKNYVNSMFSDEMGEQDQKREDLHQSGSNSGSDHTHLKRKNKKPVKKDVGYRSCTHTKKR